MPRDPDAAARAEVVQILFDYVERLRAHFETVAREHGLTHVQAKVLLSISGVQPMGALAEGLACDPSNITGVVDRMEERGWVVRGAGKADRRVRVLQLTPSGRRVRDRFTEELFGEVPGMQGLRRHEVEELRRALMALAHGAGVGQPTGQASGQATGRAAAQVGGRAGEAGGV